jgi:rhodanese-related sulfurtransferase
MDVSMKRRWLMTMLGILLLLIGAVPSVILADAPPDDLEIIRQAAANYFPYESRQYRISADDLYATLHDGDPANDPFVVSVQTRVEYALGHIPGAVNIPWDEITDVAQLQAHISKDRLTVIYCNHAVHSAQISAILNLLGYNTLDLLYGFEGWTQNMVAIPNHFDPADPSCVCEHVVETEAHTAEPTYRYPDLAVAGNTPEEIITAAANAYLASERDTNSTICPCDLEELLIDDDPANDPFVLSLQWPEGYAEGHIPKAVNIPRWELFKPENLSRLPVDRSIAVCCYLGFTSSQVVAILNMMGYDAQVTLHGLSAWTLDPEIAHFRIDDPRNWRDYPIEGTAMGTVDSTTSAPPAAPAIMCAEEYIVHADDWLSKLADKFYGDMLLFPAIAEATNQMHATDDSFAKIVNPNLIEPGWKLCIPLAEDIESKD